MTGNLQAIEVFCLAMSLLPLLAVLRLKQYAMQGMRQSLSGQIPEVIIQPLLFAAPITTFFLFDWGLTASGAMGFNVAAASVALGCGAVILKRLLPVAVTTSVPKMNRVMWTKSLTPMFLISGVYSINAQIPVLMIGAIVDIEAAGILSIAKNLADLTVTPTLALNAVLTSTAATLLAKREMHTLQTVVTKCARGATFITLPLALVFIIFGRQFLELFGTAFTGGASATALLCFGQIVNTCAGANALLLTMGGYERRVAFITTASALINCGLCVLMILLWGIAGAAAAAAVSLIIWNIWLAACARRQLGIRPTIFARLT